MGLRRRFWSRFGFISVAGDVEEGRAHLQRRISVFVGTLAVAWGANGAIGGIAAFLFLPDTVKAPGAVHLGLLHLLGTVVLVGVAVACRIGQRSQSTLNLIDAGVTVGSAVLLALMMQEADIRYRADLNVALAVTFSLVGRAAVVPGTGARTFAVGLLAALPIVPATVFLHAQPAPRLVPVPVVTLQVGAWLGLAVLLSTIVSRVIYGLSAKVREAARLGQYTLERKIGQGAMGVVYLARHALLRRPTAIKLLSPSVVGQHERERFEREVQATSALRHPNTVAIYDYGRTPDGVFYYAMEYLNGVDLERLIAHQGRLPEGRVVHILTQVAAALGEAHRAGLVHRDIKPSNILLCDHGDQPDFAKVLDFGLVKQAGMADALASIGAPLIGTPLYMSPESITTPQTIDGRSDLYALGAVGYTLVTGTPPFSGNSIVEVCLKHVNTPVELPSLRRGERISPDLEALLLSCLAKDRAQRPASAADLVGRLATCPVTAWTVADARAWWAAEGTALLQVEGPGGSSGVGETVAIDLAARDLRPAPPDANRPGLP